MTSYVWLLLNRVSCYLEAKSCCYYMISGLFLQWLIILVNFVTTVEIIPQRIGLLKLYLFNFQSLINMYYHDWNLTVCREEIFKWHLPSGFTFQHYFCHSEKLYLVWQNLINVISLLYCWCYFSNDFIMNKNLWGKCLPCTAFIMNQLSSFLF